MGYDPKPNPNPNQPVRSRAVVLREQRLQLIVCSLLVRVGFMGRELWLGTLALAL